MRKIQIQPAGSHYKARWEGGNICTFGDDPKDAAKKLKLWEKYYGRTNTRTGS